MVRVLIIFFRFVNNEYLFPFIFREQEAIRQLLTVSKDTRIGGRSEGAHLHIVHLSDSRASLDLIKVI